MIGTLAVVILFLGSVVYKEKQAMVCRHFPIPEELEKTSGEPPLYLFLFFSKHNCEPCVVKIAKMLNGLPSQFIAAGIVPNEELEDEPGLRSKTGAAFPLYRYSKFKKFLPWHTPTLFGVSPSGKIIFVLPGIEEQEAYLENIIEIIYGNMSHSFENENSPVADNKE